MPFLADKDESGADTLILQLFSLSPFLSVLLFVAFNVVALDVITQMFEIIFKKNYPRLTPPCATKDQKDT